MMATSANLATDGSDQILLESKGVSLCLLVHRRAKSLRIIDFRAGPHPAKRTLVTAVAQREGIERVFTVVERDETSAWVKLGFQREGNIPGFYKRSDAFVLGTSVSLLAGDDDEEEVTGTRPALRETLNPEQLYQNARKLLKGRPELSSRSVKVQPAKPAEVTRSLLSAQKSGRLVSSLEPFSRDVERHNFQCTARGGFSLLVSVESQPCFDNAFIELLTAPRTEKESQLTQIAVGKVCEQLEERGTVGCFAFTPATNVDLAAAFIANGFRRTGFLPQHLFTGRSREDAFLWSRKLALPDDD